MAAYAEFPLGRPRRVSLWLRLTVLVRQAQLDRRLSAGSPPADDPALALRAAQLGSPAGARVAAIGLERILEAAEEPATGFSAQVPLRRHEIHASAAELRALAAELRAVESPAPTGVARAMRLVRESDSPIYRPAPPGDLWAAARRAREALSAP